MSAGPAGGRTLSHAQALRFYDRLGSGQDGQFYERAALARLTAGLDLAEARAVVEFGCGTGRYAASLLDGRLGPEARYLGLDVSGTMVDLARRRLARFGAQAEVRQTDGAPRIPAADASCDRFVSTYVVDLLSLEDVRALLAEAHRVLAPGGLLGTAGLTHGESGAARLLSRVWGGIHRLHPLLVGGCRPLALGHLLPADAWRVRHHDVVTSWGIPSEVLVAERA